MSTFVRKKCPHCHATYESYSMGTKNSHNHIGSPFRTCYRCGSVFIDKDMKELALKPYSEHGFGIPSCFLGAIWPFGFSTAILTITAFNSPKTISTGTIIAIIVSFALYLVLVGYGIKNRKKCLLEYKMQYMESLKRLRYREYAVALKNAGFKVPSHFLEENTEQNLECQIIENNERV